MGLNVTKALTNRVLTLTVTGDYSITEMLKLVDTVRTEFDQNGSALALVDCRQMVGTMTEAERFVGGQRVAKILGSEIKTALVMPVGQVTKLGELAAVNRGARFLVTDDHKEAVEWLMSEQ